MMAKICTMTMLSWNECRLQCGHLPHFYHQLLDPLDPDKHDVIMEPRFYLRSLPLNEMFHDFLSNSTYGIEGFWAIIMTGQVNSSFAQALLRCCVASFHSKTPVYSVFVKAPKDTSIA